MVVRKRQRNESCLQSAQKKVSVAESVETRQYSCSTLCLQEATLPPTPPTTASKGRRKWERHCRSRSKVSAISWKMTMTTFLVWLCGDHYHHYYYSGNLQPSPASSSLFAHAWGSSSSSNNATTITKTKKGLQIVSACSKEDFQVEAVYLVCDSPGAYYRGSSSYRDSTTCIYGDKARLQLQFAITDSFTGASSIRLEIESGIYDQWKRVAILDGLCNYEGSNLQRVYNGYDSMTSCPTPGVYQLSTYYTVPALTSDTELHYTPDVRFRFYNAKGRVLGCATTGTLALGQAARDHAQHGLIALMTALFSLTCMFSMLMYLNCGRDRRMLADKKKQMQSKFQQRLGGGGPAGGRPQPPNPPRTGTHAEQDQRYHYFHGDDDPALNGSSDLSQTSNAGSSMSSHPNRGKVPQL